jgi:hypothetical protein
LSPATTSGDKGFRIPHKPRKTSSLVLDENLISAFWTDRLVDRYLSAGYQTAQMKPAFGWVAPVN